MVSKESVLAEFKKLGINPPGNASLAELERTLAETQRNLASSKVDEIVERAVQEGEISRDSEGNLTVAAPTAGPAE